MIAASHAMEVESRNSLSNFPDAILHHILSFLEVNDIARLRALSRRFQALCISAPSLSFSQPHHSPNCSCLHVFNFMNTLSRQRPRALKINQLSFSSFCTKRKHRKLHKQWIHKLFQAFRIDKLSLDYQLPSIFTSLSRFQSLKVLKLIMSSCFSVKLPEMKLASLEALHLEGIETEDSVGAWVSQSFPSLKSLFLREVNMAGVSTKQLDLTIRSSFLEDLTIHDCCSFKPVRIITDNLRALSYIICYSDSGRCIHNRLNMDEIVVEVSAPNLQSLMWEGAPTKLCYDRRTFKNLHVATITNLRVQNLSLVKQLFEAIRWARILHTDTDTLELLDGTSPISFGNVSYLEIQVARYFLEDDVRDVLTTSLERISNLETLTLALISDPFEDSDEAPDPFSFKDVLRKCRKTKWKKIKGLKKVKLRIRNMYHSMAFLMGMLKKSCVDMEEMTLIYPSCYHKSLKLYLNCLESASPAISINLCPPNRKRCRSQYDSLDSLKKPSRLCRQDEDNE